MARFIDYLKEMSGQTPAEEENTSFRLSSLRRILPYASEHWRKGLLGSIFMVFYSLLALPSPFMLKIIVDKILVEKNQNLLGLILISLIGVQVARTILAILTDFHFSVYGQEVLTHLKKELFYRILRLPLSFFDKNQTGYILSRIGEVDGLAFFFSSALIRILIGFFEFIFCLGMLIILNWRLSLLSLAILPFFFFAARRYSKNIKNIAFQSFEKGAGISWKIQDSLSAIDVIKSFVAEDRETDKLKRYFDENKFLNIRRNLLITCSTEWISLIGALAGLVILWVSGQEIIHGSFTLGGYLAFSAYLARLYGPTQTFANLGVMLLPSSVALNRINWLMSLDSEEDTCDNKIDIKGIKRCIEFQNICFSYDKSQVLSDISFKITIGERVEFRGPNGAGKSTVIKLLMGLYTTELGTILIDDCDINGISLSSLRSRISIVSQNTFLFNDTIKNNILYSQPEATSEGLEEAVRLAGAHEFIANLERGLDSEIGERGIRLSGGERQKISIARALIKDADVIIFDEATAHLDPESEKGIWALIKSRFQNKICIIITQKATYFSEMNKVIFFNKGRIIKIEEQIGSSARPRQLEKVST